MPTGDEGRFVDEDTLRLILRAEFAEFKNQVIELIAARVKDTVSQHDHLALAKRVDANADAIDALNAWRNRIVGGLALALFLAGFAIELAVRKFF